MKIIHYATVTALAIGLCATQCRALTADEWMTQYIAKITDEWMSQYNISKITDNNQKSLLASFLYWHIKAKDAWAAARAERDAAWNADSDAEVAAEAAKVAAGDTGVAASAALDAALSVEQDAGDTAGAIGRVVYESFYVALWNKDKNVLANKEVYGGPAGIKFPVPENGKIKPLYP